MEINEDKAQQNENCNDSSGSGGDCCSSGSGNWKSWKTVIFILVLLAAGALAAHSVLSKGTNSPCGAGSAGVCPMNKPCGATEANPGNVTSPSEKKVNNPPSCCPKTAVPSGCPKTAVPSGCPKTASPSGSSKTETPSCCPKTSSN
ncbi:MAG: hypothetical protein ACYTDW_06225 [Planctomycetota bacterium]